MRGTLRLAIAGAVAAQKSSGGMKRLPAVVKLQEQLKTAVEDTKKFIEVNEEDRKTMACWCEETSTDLNESIDKNNICIQTADEEIKTMAAKREEHKVARASAEENHTKAKNDLEDETVARKAENKQYVEEAAELVGMIAALSGAMTAVKCHDLKEKFDGKGSFLQTGERHPVSDSELSTLSQTVKAYSASKPDRLSKNDRKVMTEFLATSKGQGAYQAQNGAICGIIIQMHDDFTNQRDHDKKKEDEAVATFKDMRETLEGLIDSNKKLAQEMAVAAGEAGKKHSKAVNLLKGCQADLEENKENLLQTTKNCEEAAADFETRAETRQRELDALGNALDFLRRPEIIKATSRTSPDFLQESFLQIASKRSSKMAIQSASLEGRGQLQQGLKLALKTSRASKYLALMQQATKASQDPTDGVAGGKAAFLPIVHQCENLLIELDDKHATNVKEYDSCIKITNDNDLEIQQRKQHHEKKTSDKESTETELNTTIENRKAAEEEQEKRKNEFAKMSQMRQEENLEFQKGHQEMSAEVDALQMVQKLLSVEFKDHAGKVEFLQQQPVASEYEESAGSGILTFLLSMIKETKQDMALNSQMERKGQAEYEAWAIAANKQLKGLYKTINQQSYEIAQLEGELARLNVEVEHAFNQYQDKTEDQANHKKTCNFLVTNFNSIQEHIRGEQKAIRAAVNFFKGMK